MIEGIDLDSVEWELGEANFQVGYLKGMSVHILDEKNSIPGIRFEGRSGEGFSLKGRQLTMSRPYEISLEYKHTNSDGSSDSVKVGVKADNEDREVEKSSDTNNENDNKASDIDSRDRDHDKDD